LNHINVDIEDLLVILKSAWSIHSSSKWSKTNPAKGQCGVTALVVNDIYGGEIYKTPTLEGWHFYNKINNNFYDLTASQFSTKIHYMNILSNREEAFADTNENQYRYLKEKVLKSIMLTREFN